MLKPIDDDVVALQARIFAGRLKLNEVLNRAHVNRSTWSRWVKGGDPKKSTIKRIHQAIDAKIGEREQPETIHA